MKIPESAAPSYYGDEAHWQGNGMVAEPAGGGYSGVAGAIPTPVYPPQIRGHIQPGYMSVPTAYYPVYPVANAPPPSGPEALPHGPPGPHGVPPALHHNTATPLPIDFSEYMWMENEEEFDKQVMQQLEEEALMEQCIEAMLEDERERLQHNRQNGRHTNGVEGKPEVSKSTLNPLAAEFVPGGGYTSPVVTARSPSPTPQCATTVSTDVNVNTGTEESPAESKEVSSDSSRDDSPSAPEEVATPVPSPPPPVQVQTPPVAEASAEAEVEVVHEAAEESEVKVDVAPIVEVIKEKTTPEPEAPALKQQRDQSSRLSRRKPTMADVVGTGKKGDKTPPGLAKTNLKAARSETRVPTPQAKGKDVKQVKSEPKLELKSKESPQLPVSGQDKTSKEELIKQTVHPSTEGFMAPAAVASNTSQSAPKPINYAAAAKANRPQARPSSAPAPPQAQAPAKKPTK